jgi:GAF domain-containing protein
LYRIVVDEFVDARTEQELEAGVVEGLARRGHDLAWIGTVDGADINSRAVGGDREFFATLGSALAEPREGAEPFVRAARTGEGQYLGDIETLLSAEWRDAALDAGYRSAIAVPLSYHDVSYGVLAVYSREPDRFGERERHRRSCSRVTSSEAARRSPDAIVVFRCGTLAVVSDFRFWKRE